MGDKTTTTTQSQYGTSTSNPYAPAEGLIQNVIDKAGALPTGATGAQTATGNKIISTANGLPNFTPQSTNAINSVFGQTGMLNDNLSNLQRNLSGLENPANLNPMLTPGISDALNTVQNDITNQVKGVYAASGRDPSGAGSFGQSLGRGLTQGMAPILTSQYNANVGNMLSANQTGYNAGNATAGAVSGNTLAALQAAGILPQNALAAPTAAFNTANTMGGNQYQGFQQVLQAAGLLGGMGGTTTNQGWGQGTQVQQGSTLGNIMGGLSGVAGILGAFKPSDERLKENIEEVGELHDGQKVYGYNYKGDDRPQIGLLAHEVERHHPEAVAEIGGYKAVHYGLATRNAARPHKPMGLLKRAA